MAEPDKVAERPSNQKHGVLLASLALPILDIAGIMLVRLITTSENRPAALGLYTIIFAIGCVFVLFGLLLSNRRPLGYVIVYIWFTCVLTLLNFGVFVFARSWGRTFESM